MKVLLCLNGKKYGGAEKMCLQLADELANRNYQVELLLNHQSADQSFSYQAHILEHQSFFSQRKPFTALAVMLKFLKVLITGKYNLVIFENKYLLQAGIRLVKLLGIKNFIYLHYPPADYEVKRCGYLLADRIIVCSDKLQRYFKDSSLEFITLSNFADDSSLAEAVTQVDRDSSELNIVLIGHINPVKGQDIAIEVMKLLVKDFSELKLYLIGPEDSGNQEYLQDCKNKVEAACLSSNVIFTGKVDNVAEYLAGADVYFQPSRAEGLPIAAIEALAASLPIVSSNVDGLVDIVVNQENGYLVENQDIQQYYEKIKKLLEDSQLREVYAKNSRVRFEKKFTYQKYQEDLAKILESL